MSEQNRRRKAKEEITVARRNLGVVHDVGNKSANGEQLVEQTIRHMIDSRFRLRAIAAGVAVGTTPGNSQWIQMAQWLFNEASPSELRAVAKAIEKHEMAKPKRGDFDLKIARETYLEVREARAGKRDKRSTLAEVRDQVLRNCEKWRVVFGEGQETKRAFSSGKDSQRFNLIDRTLRKILQKLRKELGGFALRPDKRRRPKGS